MKLKNLKIKTRLMIGLAVMLFFVIASGVVAYIQTNLLNHQTESMYNHPLEVRKALGELECDILTMRLGLRDLMLAVTEEEKQAAMQMMNLAAADAEKQFNIIKARYLGPKTDVDDAYQAYIVWLNARALNTVSALSGDIEKVKASVFSNGTVGKYRDDMLAAILKIDEFASQKSSDFLVTSMQLKDTLKEQLIILISAFTMLSILISYNILQNIRKPLKDMSNAVRCFHQGDMNARSTYMYKNEFGVLATSLNTMMDLIQLNMNLKDKMTNLADVMLSEDDAKEFFKATLGALAIQTDSQMAAVYLLSNDQENFEYFESIGLDNDARQSFKADLFEGEFGRALFTGEIQYIGNIPEDTRFLFHTVNGKFIPNEIITIPIQSGDQVIAVISLACIGKFAEQSIAMVKAIHVTMSARIQGILAYQKIMEFKEELELQNHELDVQKSELSAQTVELTQQNTELEMQKKQLNEANRLKTNFLSNMSHELRTPLNSVIALAGVLNRRLKDHIPEEEYSYLQVIERNGKNLLRLINDILDISRIEAGREEIEITKFHINGLINEVVSMIYPQAKRKNINLSYQNNESDLLIQSDMEKCRHILQNIIGNAVKFTEKGKVVVTAYQNDSNIEIKVTDTGIGIAEEHLPYIFDEFRQADGSTSRRFGGSGLGLAIAKKYSNLLGGTILVRSIPDTGSEFSLFLPMQYTEDKTTEEDESDDVYEIKPQKQKHDFKLTEKTVLLVEDNESAIIQIKDLEDGIGCRVLVAHNAEEALVIIGQVTPDAMILDLMMPGTDGFELLKILRNAEATAHIPVLILTAKHLTKDDLRFLKRNNIHQLIQKGYVNRIELQNAIIDMVMPKPVELEESKKKVQLIGGKPVVLVVEDNPDNMLTARALLDERYTVIEAMDGSEGIEKAKEFVPDLILMDIALVGIDGIEAFEAIRSMPKLQHIPIIALTASAMTHDRETVLSYGFDAFIAKPIIEKEFYKMINEVLYGQ